MNPGHDLSFLRTLLANAMAHWKLVFGITATRPRISYLGGFAFGSHIATQDELALQQDEEEAALVALEHTATFLCVNQAHAVLEKLHPLTDTQTTAFHIARLLRNSFAHDPFAPVWLFGARLERPHYGGPLAILRLTQLVDALVASRQSPDDAPSGTHIRLQ